MALFFAFTISALLEVVPAASAAQDTVGITVAAVEHVARKASQPIQLLVAPRAMPAGPADLRIDPDRRPMISGVDRVASAVGARVAPVDYFDQCMRPRSPASECTREERVGLISVSLPTISGDTATIAVSIVTRPFAPEVAPEKTMMSYATYRVLVVRSDAVWKVAAATITSGS